MNKDAEYLLKAFFDYMYDPDLGRVSVLDVPRETIEARLMETGVAHKKKGDVWASNKETKVYQSTTPIFYRSREIKKLNNLFASFPNPVKEYCRNRYKAFMVADNKQRYLKIKEIQFRMKYTSRTTFYEHRKKWEKYIVNKLKESGLI